ncbi:MAG: methyltransferase domain-containing protein [Betaproteobacteria bacterium]
MKERCTSPMLKSALLACALALAGCAPAAPEVRYEPSPMPVVEAMLGLAAVGSRDVVYDLGCGDGRIVIAAARRGARAVCIDIDPRRIAEARANAARDGVGERIRFLQQDLLESDLREATVVTLFLSAGMNRRLRPKLERELAPGARVVSHWHDMGDWQPERSMKVRSDNRDHPVYSWTMPGR